MSDTATEYKMDADLKAKWVAALRGGAYRQGRNRLHPSKNEYCCLGVLCDITGYQVWEQDPNRSCAPFSLILNSAQIPLMQMNDTERKTFPEIADWIEANL